MKRKLVRKACQGRTGGPGALKVLAVLLPLILAMAPAVGAQETVTGTVISSDGARPLPGVSVALVGTNVGTITDASGRYTLEVNDPATDTLAFSSIGFHRSKMPLSSL